MKPENTSSDRDQESTPAERYVEFQYAETKDLTKQFLTLIAGTLVLTLTVAEKLLGATSVNASLMLCTSWALLILAFILAGTGLAGIFYAGLAAREGSLFGHIVEYKKIGRVSYPLIVVAGFLYVAALVLLVVVGSLRIFP